jgi:uncharacterized alkaline shock family protein YloU
MWPAGGFRGLLLPTLEPPVQALPMTERQHRVSDRTDGVSAMTDTSKATATTASSAGGAASTASSGKTLQNARQNSGPAGRGKTTIADGVVEKITGLAAREVVGVHALGSGGLARTFGAVRERVPGGRPNITRGVKVEVGETQAAIDVDLVVEYGVSIVEVAGAVRENVISAVERMTGLEVVEVNIVVDDIKLPDDTEDSDEETRLK